MIPAYIVAIFLIWADVMWILYLKHRLAYDARPLIVTLALEATMYIAFSVFEIDIEVRRELVRMSLIVIAFSMAFPLTLLYFAGMKRHGQ